MKRSIISTLSIAMFLVAAIAIAQGTREEQEQIPQRGVRQPVMGQRMGRMRQTMPGMRGEGMTGMRGQRMERGVQSGNGMRDGRMQSPRQMRDGNDLYLNLRDVLELDDAQVTKLRQIRLENIEATGDVQTDLRVARLELRELLDAEKLNMKAVENKISDIHEFEAELETQRVRARFDAQAVLTPEQLEKVESGQSGRGMLRGMPGRRN